MGFEDGFPLHPITLFALDRLSKKVAQNERTFFTYLAGDEENALFAQLSKYDIKEFHFIGLDEIYDYFRNEATSDSVSSAIDSLGGDYEEFEIRLVRIKFLCEIAN